MATETNTSAYKGKQRLRRRYQTGSKAEAIDAVVTVDEADVETNRRALDCTITYKETIETHRDGTKIKEFLSPHTAFEIYQEAHDPPLESLVEGLTED